LKFIIFYDTICREIKFLNDMVYKSVYIIGPRLANNYNQLKSLFNGENDIIIGDGKKRLTEEDIAILAGKIDSNTRIIVECHAGFRTSEPSYEQFDIECFRGFWGYNIKDKDIEKLWCALNKASGNQPLQINLFGCCVGSAGDSLEILPLGSVLMMYSPKDDTGWLKNDVEIIKSIMACKHLSNPFQVFLDNIITNLSNCGTSIAIKEATGIREVCFALNAENLNHGISTYLATTSHEIIKFYAENKQCIESFSVLVRNCELAAKSFFQDDNLNEHSFTKNDLDILTAKMIESKFCAKDPDKIAALDCVLQEEHKQLKLAHGNSLLHHAVNKGEVDVMELLIKKGFNIDEKNDYGNTPLHLAAINGYIATVECLIQNGTDINARNNCGKTPLHEAIKNNSFVITLYLIEQGATIDAKNDYGNTPLHYAAMDGKSASADFLVKNGANIHAKNCLGYTPIQLAAENGHFEVVKSLLEHGTKNTGFWGWLEWTTGSSPEQLADKNGHTEIAEYIKSYNNGFSSEVMENLINNNVLVDNLKEISEYF
jgi:ankyrin repeat protein